MAKTKKNSNYVTENRARKLEEKLALKRKRKIKGYVKTAVIYTVSILLIAAVIVGICALGGAFKYRPKATSHVTVKLSNGQSLHVELYGNDAPETVKKFLSDVGTGFYKNAELHTFVNGLIYAGQTNKGVLYGGIKGEFAANGFKNKIKHERGIISMSRNDDGYDSAFGQFFIVTEKSPGLDGNYAAFGKITEGMDIIDTWLKNMQVDENGNITSTYRLTITDISVHEAH